LKSIIISQKREFNEANLMVWFFDWNNLESLKVGLEYFKKIILSRKAFIPILLVGYRYKTHDQSENKSKYVSIDKGNENIPPELRFLQLIQFQKNLRNITEHSIRYFEIEEQNTEKSFLRKLKDFTNRLSIKYGETYKIKKYSTITLERLFKDLEELIEQLNGSLSQNLNFDNLIKNLTNIELKMKTPITRRFLIEQFGSNKKVAKKIMNRWESRPGMEQLNDEFQNSVRQYASDLLKHCYESNTKPTYVHLVSEGYKLTLIQPILRYLQEQDKISSVSSHLISEDFWEFKNIEEVIIRHEGRVLYVKSSNNLDHTLMFSDMIYTLESIRNEYLLKTEKREIDREEHVEFLEFGNLRALIGYGKRGVKIILRLNQNPRNKEKLKHRCMEFLTDYEKQINLTPAKEAKTQKKIKNKSAKIYYQHFNPFPETINVFRKIKINKKRLKEEEQHLCNIEKKIIEVLRSFKELSIEELIKQVFEKNSRLYSNSDIIAYLLDLLMKDKILI